MIDRLSDVALDDTLTAQRMEPAKHATQIHHRTDINKIMHYPTTIHPEAVYQIKEALPLELLNTRDAHQPGAFTAYWKFPTDAGMVPNVAETTLPRNITALATVVQAIARKERAQLHWTPDTLVEKRVHHNANKAQQTGRQIHPQLRDKDSNLQPHSPWMVHFNLGEHGDNRKGTEVHFTHIVAHTHLQYTFPTSNMVVTYWAAQRSTYRLQPNAEGTAYTVYTWAQYKNPPGPTWHLEPTGHQPLHKRRMPRQGRAKHAGNNPPGETTPPNIINSVLGNARMPLMDTGCSTLTTPPTAKRGAPSNGPYIMT